MMMHHKLFGTLFSTVVSTFVSTIVSSLLLSPLLAAEPAEVNLGVPSQLDLYQDGGHLLYRIAVPAGTTSFVLPSDIGHIVQVDGADGWHNKTRSDTSAQPPLPPVVLAFMGELNQLGSDQAALHEREQFAERLADDIRRRLPLRSQDAAPDQAAWQASIDALVQLRRDNTRDRLAIDDQMRAIRERVDATLIGNYSLADLLALSDSGPRRAWSNEQLERQWQAMSESITERRLFVVERRDAGVITLHALRTDIGWTPQTRMVIDQQRCSLIRQALVTMPAQLSLPALPTRLIAGGRSQPLAGGPLQPRRVERVDAPVTERRSVTVTTRAADWQDDIDDAVLVSNDRIQTWVIAGLTLHGADGAQVVELQNNVLDVLTDEWLLAPELRPVLARRLSLRLDARPLLAGSLELVVDGTVMGRHSLGELSPGTVLNLSGGEDQRIFVAKREPWEEDPNRPPNRKREGESFLLRNLSTVPVRFVCYLTVPVSSVPELTRTIDPQTTAGWAEGQPGILRWVLELKPGEERVLERGWVVEAAGQIRL